MEVTFDDPGLRLTCEDADVTTETYGVSIAHAIQNRIADLQAAISLNDIIVGQPTQINDNTFRVNLIDDYVIYFSAVNKKVTHIGRGEINKGSVNRIKLLSIELHTTTQ